ncbi:MAG: hypothetical protein L0Z47_06760 [Actinobacteria bacterium]|nr:hypothetical protein [Actinomycetota bacterium]MCI0678898.1 hypothetical protein [Actinomycetota bacterium]
MPGQLGDEAESGELYRASGLAEVAGLIEMDPLDKGWNRESARLFAIDAAMLACREGGSLLGDAELRQMLLKLGEARRLVVDDRDYELEWLLDELLPYLAHSSATRPTWATVMNALLPCPYRSAVATCRGVLVAHPREAETLSSILRDRLRARLDEGALLRPEYAVA